MNPCGTVRNDDERRTADLQGGDEPRDDSCAASEGDEEDDAALGQLLELLPQRLAGGRRKLTVPSTWLSWLRRCRAAG